MTKKWGKIGAPNSKKRKLHLAKIRKKAVLGRKKAMKSRAVKRMTTKGCMCTVCRVIRAEARR